MLTALLAIGGEGPGRDRLADRLASFDLVCAADSGLELLDGWKVAPDLIVGDMDSLRRPELLGAFPHAEVIVFPRHKDESDTELGLRILSERGAGRIVIAGGGEGRLDHLLAVRAIFERSPRPMEWYTAHEWVGLVEEGGFLELPSRAGDILSVFPLAGGASGMTSSGLRWPLAGLVWGPGDFSLSNESVGDRVAVGAGRGDLLLIRNYG